MAPRGKKTRVKNVAKKINSIADVAGDLTQNAETVSPFLAGKDISKNYFRRIPIEIRQMIYALAVIDQDVIEPLQVEKRSNKFCGGQTAAKAFSGLLLTCRMFREELKDRPDFYQGHRTFLVGGLGVSADHGNLRFSGEQGFVDTDAALVDLVQRLNSRLLELGTFCGSKYVIDKPIVGRRFQEALVCLELDVFGDNRAGQSHQSGMVTENPKYIDTYESEDNKCIFDD
ncbi:hypothetical protein QIS74_11723 [Colletotrichum tabaci]|uniref:Uncharacterized protein n=1 Tax=Colletotrichum tabaci TaxID=1209068 RepID=A0AAV9SZ72_9PEZI